MPIDYSKFNNIEDSDEEEAVRDTSASKAVVQGRQTNSGREKLEGTGLEERLSIFPTSTSPAPPTSKKGPSPNDQFAGLAGELDRWAAPRPESEPAKPGEPQIMCVRSDGRKKIHTTFPDGAETVEEFDERTDVLLERRVRQPQKLGGEGQWVYEVGQAPEAPFDPHGDTIRASTSNPIFLRKDTPEQFQWRVRNLAYPSDVYSVTIDHEKQDVVVRTSNKKYFKRIGVPDLARVGVTLKDNLLTWKHQHNTLIISYVKPEEVLAQERKALREVEKSAIKM